MALRRGFKTEANALGAEIRRELQLRARDRLDPLQLAAHLEIPVVPLSDMQPDAPSTEHLLYVEPEAFSAVTVFAGRKRMIVYNDRHSPGRQASSITHEAAHGLLLHEPKPAVDHRGCRLWDQEVEDEADWLAGVLLVPEDAAVAVARDWLPEADAALHFGVSEQMLNYRLNITGARLRVQRALARGPRR
ncbi:MAG: ImmA/IrrE family metallo-endopeptidase [Pseudonocardiaceae bacterium]